MIPYLNFNYIYPPRPEFKVAPEELHKFEENEFLAQPKYNGSCCLVFTNGETCYVYNRHKNILSNVSADIDFNQLAKSDHWYVYAGEYLNKSKSCCPIFNNFSVLHSISATLIVRLKSKMFFFTWSMTLC